MSWVGFVGGMGPDPGSTLGGPAPSTRGPGRQVYNQEERKRLDPRVLWAQNRCATLKQQRASVSAQMRKALDMARGKQWSGNRAPWKAASRINYCAWVAEQWAAVLTDNKPRAAFSALRPEDAWKADVATAAWLEWYDEEDVQTKIADCEKLAAIVKKAFLKLTYDPMARKGQGNQKAQVIPGWQVYADEGASSIDDALLVMHEYTESEGVLLYTYPHLRGRLAGAERRPESALEGDTQIAPRQHVTADAAQWGGAGTADYHLGSYEGPTSGDHTLEGSLVVREFWMRPRGPESMISIERPQWTALGKPAVTHRLVEFADGHLEPMQLVLLASGVLYEVPMSAVALLQQAQQYGGPQVLKVRDSYQARMETEKVPLYPTGRRLVIVGDQVAADSCNPFAHGEFPFIEFECERDGSRFWPQSLVDKVVDMQDYLNRLYSLLLDAAILTSNPVWVIPQQTELADEEITNAPGAIIRVDPVFLKSGASRRQGPEMPSYVREMLLFTIDQIRQVSGLSDAATGGKFKGQQAAETVSMYQEAAGVRFRQGIRLTERAMIKLGYQFVKNVAQFYGQPRLVRLEKAAGIERTVSFIGAQLVGDLRLKVKAGSMLPTSPTARMAQIMQTVGLPFPTFDLPELYAAWEEFGLIQNGDAMMSRLQKLAQQMGLQGEQWKWPMAWMKLMGPPPGKGKGGAKKRSASLRSARQRPPGT